LQDQSHWSIPRFRDSRPSKYLAASERPRVVLQGVWCFNTALHFYALDPTLAHGGQLNVSVAQFSAQPTELAKQELRNPKP
jgi:hypothetical protein